MFRVFVSSTFKDMKLERDVLANKIFPRLRKRCESCRVVWGDVDVHRGVSSEAIAEGRTRDYCVEEIRRANCFVALISERCGSVPTGLPPQPRVVVGYAGPR